jgi:hypothetical protein
MPGSSGRHFGGRIQECLTSAVEIFLFFNPACARSVEAWSRGVENLRPTFALSRTRDAVGTRRRANMSLRNHHEQTFPLVATITPDARAIVAWHCALLVNARRQRADFPTRHNDRRYTSPLD